MRARLVLFCVSLGLTASVAPAREPVPALDVAARLVSVDHRAGTGHVAVELSITSDRDAPAARVSGQRSSGRPAAGAVPLDVRRVSLAAGRTAVVRYELDLEPGREHVLLFTVDESDRRSTAYLRVNLDPALEPADLGTVLQYRTAPAADSPR